MEEMFDIEGSAASNAKIKVIGVGGGGGNAVKNMIEAGLRGVHFICANTDVQALNKSSAKHKIQLGVKLTRGLGAGSIPQVGRDAALESVDSIREVLHETDMLFVTAGMGGGTGTGAAPIIAQAAREMGILTVGVVTKPFSFEGAKRKVAAEVGLEEFRQHVDCLIVVPNDRLLAFAPKKAPATEMFKKANDVLYYAVKGISDVILEEGFINLDFADVHTVMHDSGLALMGTGVASGENRAREAAQRAIMSPLLEDVSLEGARAVLYNITAPADITMDEMGEIGDMIQAAAHPDANIIFGVVYGKEDENQLSITVIATGIESGQSMDTVSAPAGATVTRFHKPGPGALSPMPGPRQQPRQMPAPVATHAQDTGTGSEYHQGNRRTQVGQWVDVNSQRPPYARKREVMGMGYMERDTLSHTARRPHIPGADDFVYNAEDFEVPAFIRSQAD